jgi:1-acyl-sn-glycerol-3-phosphate acyltransferase
MAETVDRSGEIPHPRLYNVAIHTAVSGFLSIWGKLIVSGEENVQKQTGGYILAPNHRSMIDILALGLAADRAVPGTQIHFMGKQELWNLPLIPKLFSALGGFSIDRSRSLQEETVSHVGAIARNGGVLGIFPEGTRRHGKMIDQKDIKRGVTLLALQLGMPIVPVGIDGTEKHDRGPIAVTFGETIIVPHVDLGLINVSTDELLHRTEQGSRQRQLVIRSVALRKRLFKGMQAVHVDAIDRRSASH